MVDEQELRVDKGQLICANKLELLREQLCCEDVGAVPPQGLYLYGGVGCGKTMLMDLFVDAVSDSPDALAAKRVHFHEFMLSVHKRLREEQERIRNDEGGLKLEVLPGGYLGRRVDVKLFGMTLYTNFEYDAFDPFKETQDIGDGAVGAQKNAEKSAAHEDPLVRIARELVSESSLICFDEFQVTDIADAMILQRLFEVLFDEGMVMVATSNREPTELYKGGVAREGFLPFIDLLQDKCVVHNMDSSTDYRVIGERAEAIFAYPTSDPAARARFEETWAYLTKHDEVGAAVTPAPGVVRLGTANRELKVPLMYPPNHAQIARFHFTDLCDGLLSSKEYLALGDIFHTIFIEVSGDR
jgi:predicted ATPase